MLRPLLALSLLRAGAPQEWQAISGGGQWDAGVVRGTQAQCGTDGLDGLDRVGSNICCNSCGGEATPCEDDNVAMFDRTGYTCAQIAGGEIDYLHCNQLVRDITAEEAYEMWIAGTIDLMIDVRSPSEFESAGDPAAHNACGHGFSDEWDGCEIGHIPGSYLVPLNPWDSTQLEACAVDDACAAADLSAADPEAACAAAGVCKYVAADETTDQQCIPKPVTEMTVATTCYNHASHPDSAWRSNTGAALLEQLDFLCVFNIIDGTKGWRERGYPVTMNEAWPAEPGSCLAAPYYQAGLAYADTPLNCAANQKVVGNACIDCPEGYANEGGDDPTGADTECDGDGTGGLAGVCDVGFTANAEGTACDANPTCAETFTLADCGEGKVLKTSDAQANRVNGAGLSWSIFSWTTASPCGGDGRTHSDGSGGATCTVDDCCVDGPSNSIPAGGPAPPPSGSGAAPAGRLAWAAVALSLAALLR